MTCHLIVHLFFRQHFMSHREPHAGFSARRISHDSLPTLPLWTHLKRPSVSVKVQITTSKSHRVSNEPKVGQDNLIWLRYKAHCCAGVRWLCRSGSRGLEAEARRCNPNWTFGFVSASLPVGCRLAPVFHPNVECVTLSHRKRNALTCENRRKRLRLFF